MAEIDKLNDKVEQIQEDLKNIKEAVISESERKEKIKQIKEKAINLKREIETSMDTLKDKTKEEVKTLLNSLNDLINFKASMWEVEQSWQWNQWGWEDEVWLLIKTKGRIWNQLDDVFNKDKWKQESWKNVLRTAWFAATWVWLVVLSYRWLKNLFWKEEREKRRERRKERREARIAAREERRQEVAKLPFWERPIGKILKRTWIWTWIVWGMYALKERLNKSKLWKMRWFESECKELKSKAEEYLMTVADPEEYDLLLKDALTLKTRSEELYNKIKESSADEKAKDEVGKIKDNIEKYIEEIESMKWEIYVNASRAKMHWFESECKELKSKAKKCLQSSTITVVEPDKNKQEYDLVLKDALALKTRSEELYNKIKESSADEKAKDEAEKIKDNIEKYIEEIESMKWQIYASASHENWWYEGGWQSDSPTLEAEWLPENFKSIDPSIICQATVDCLDNAMKEKHILLDDETKNKVEASLNNYLQSYPLLKIDENGKMVIEIKNKLAFSKIVKQLRNDVLSWLWVITELTAKGIVGNKMDDINKTLTEMDSKSYENIIFQYFGWIVRNAVVAWNWTMTVQEYYDGISRYYPNKNNKKISSDILASGQADLDIKDMKYPFVV